jgi:hypothetical protein
MTIAGDFDPGRLLRHLAAAVAHGESAKLHVVSLDRDHAAQPAAVEHGAGRADNDQRPVDHDPAVVDAGFDCHRAPTRCGVEPILQRGLRGCWDRPDRKEPERRRDPDAWA